MSAHITARALIAGAAVFVSNALLAGCLGGGSGGVPLFLGDATVELSLDPPLAVERSGRCVCRGVSADEVVDISAEGLGELDGNPLYLSVDLTDRGAGDASPHVLVGLVGVGPETDALPPTWASSPESTVELDLEDPRSGTVSFSELPFVQPVEDQPGYEMDVEGWPETISGSITWSCGPLREAQAP
ncbi:MAG: hypothetical protein ABR509_05895 [Candidatus Limnocylindria bacterium]